MEFFRVNQHTATHCSTLQHTATHCNTLQHAVTHCNAQQLTTGWRRCIGCPKSQVIFRKKATNHRALLQKKTSKGIIWVCTIKASSISSNRNTLQHPATHYITPQHTTTTAHSSETLQHSVTRCNKHSATLALQHATTHYGVALVSRIDKIIGLFCKRAL